MGLLCKFLVLIDGVHATLTAHDDILGKLLNEEVKTMDQKKLVELLLELKDITLKYDPINLRCSDIHKK